MGCAQYIDPMTAPEPTGQQQSSESTAGGGTPDLVVGYVPGVMPGKWFGRWRDRGMQPQLDERQVGADAWREALEGVGVTACFVRLGWNPTDPTIDRLRKTHHAILIYEELRVTVLSREDVLTVLDTLTTVDLTGETTPQEQPRLDDAAAAVQLTAAGAGPVVLPMSVARLHARRDVTFRELTDTPPVPVLLVWRKDLDERTEAAVQRFVGVVRGRRPGSDRGDGGATAASERPTGGTGDGDSWVSAATRNRATGGGTRGRPATGTRGSVRKKAASSAPKNRRRRPRG